MHDGIWSPISCFCGNIGIICRAGIHAIQVVVLSTGSDIRFYTLICHGLKIFPKTNLKTRVPRLVFQRMQIGTLIITFECL